MFEILYVLLKIFKGLKIEKVICKIVQDFMGKVQSSNNHDILM